MRVDNTLAYRQDQTMRTSKSTPNTNVGQTSIPSSKNGETVTSRAAKATAVTGTTSNNLSSTMMSQLMATAQEPNTSNTNVDQYSGPLSVGERRYLNDIAKDPAYAASEAKLSGTASELVFAYKTSAELMASIHSGSNNSDARLASMKEVQGQRTAYYESLAAQGLPPAETFAKILEFNVNLSKSHDDTLGWSASGRTQSYSDYNQSQLDYLQNAIAQSNSNKTTGLGTSRA